MKIRKVGILKEKEDDPSAYLNYANHRAKSSSQVHVLVVAVQNHANNYYDCSADREWEGHDPRRLAELLEIDSLGNASEKVI